MPLRYGDAPVTPGAKVFQGAVQAQGGLSVYGSTGLVGSNNTNAWVCGGAGGLMIGSTSILQTAVGSLSIDGTGNGQRFGIKTLTELTTVAAAATTDTTILMPAGALILGVTVRVTVVIPTATNFTVGDSGSAARFSTAAVSSAANSVDSGTKAGCYYNAGALAVRFTPDQTPGANSGRIRVTIHYVDLTAPTS